MRLTIKLMLVVLGLALLLPFTLLKDNQGNTMLSFSDFSMPEVRMPDFADMFSSKNLIPSAPGSDGMDVFYKWYDGEGNVHYTTEPPAEGIAYVVKEFDPDANVIQAVELPEAEPAGQTRQTAGQDDPNSQQVSIDAYDPDQIKKLFEDTENIEKLLQQRSENQNSALN